MTKVPTRKKELIIPKLLLKKRRGYCNHLHLSVMLSPKPLDEIWRVSYMNGVCNVKLFLPHPLGRGQKVKYHLISITKSFSKIFIPNFVCFFTNERYKTYQTGFSLSPGSCPRGGTLRHWGQNASKIFILGSNW